MSDTTYTDPEEANESPDDELTEIHAEAMKRFDAIQSATYQERQLCLSDRRFVLIPGAQWEGPLQQQFENKPRMEINKSRLGVVRIINEKRNNPVTVKFVSKDEDEADLADTATGLFRADEKASQAEIAYNNAFEEAVEGGFGAWRLRAVYEDEEDEDSDYQSIQIEPIYEADACVFFDQSAQRPDKSDAKHCFVLTAKTPEEFKEEWGIDPTTFPKVVTQSMFDWVSTDIVYVAEYYCVEEVKEMVQVWKDLIGNETKYYKADFIADPKLLETLKATGSTFIRKKATTRKKVHKYILSGYGVLEDSGYIAGKNIPIVPEFGWRGVVDGIERMMGHVRPGKDPQRILNVEISKMVELAAMSSGSIPILLAEQVKGYETAWAQRNLTNPAYLTVNPITDAQGNALPTGPVSMLEPPQIPQAQAALIGLANDSLQEILGNRQNTDKIVSNISAKATDMIMSSLDMQTYMYVSNFAMSMKRSGEIWLSMAKELYTDIGRQMRTVDDQGQMDTVKIGTPEQGQNALVQKGNDLTKAQFDVDVDIGPTSKSRRDAVVNGLQDLLRTPGLDPQTTQVLTYMILMNSEGEGIADLREFYRKQLVKLGVLDPTDEEAKAMAAQAAQPDPNAQALQAYAEAQQAQAEKDRVEILSTLAEVKKTQEQAEYTHAQTLQILSNIEQGNLEQAMKIAGQLQPPAQEVAQAPGS